MKSAAIALLASAALASGALAQSLPSQPAQPTPPATTSGIEKNQGLGGDKPPERSSPAESNAVTSLGSGAVNESAPPAMRIDCQKEPQRCSEPVAPTGSTAPGMPQQSK